MGLNTSKLSSDMLALFKEMRTKEKNADEEFANKFASIMETFVKSGEVVVEAGIATQVSTGSGQGATIEVGTGIIK